MHESSNTTRSTQFLYTKAPFVLTIFAVGFTCLAVWLSGFGSGRTVVENSLISVSVLAAAFFLFISVGLFNGLRLKDDLGALTNRFEPRKYRDLVDFFTSTGFPDLDDAGILGLIVGFVLWFIVAFIAGILLWLFGMAIWFSILVFLAMLYWVYYRALKLVFRKAAICRGRLFLSISYGAFYTALYTSWIYGVIFLADFLSHTYAQ